MNTDAEMEAITEARTKGVCEICGDTYAAQHKIKRHTLTLCDNCVVDGDYTVLEDHLAFLDSAAKSKRHSP